MKIRNLLLFMGIGIIIFTSGCGSEETKDNKTKSTNELLSDQITLEMGDADMICTLDTEFKDEEYTLGSKYVIYEDGNGIVERISSQELIQSTNREVLEKFEQYTNENYTIMANYGGLEFEVTNEKGIVTSTVDIDYNKMDIESYANDYPDSKNYINDNNQFTLDSIKDMYESMGANCKEK